MQALAGKTILVTGGLRGIGAAIVKAILKDGGKPIVHFGRDQAAAEQLLEASGGTGFAIGADFSHPDAPARLFEEALARAGRIHGVVNNAGLRIVVDISADHSAWHAAWARELQVNLVAAADICRAAVLHFRECGGHIIMSSRVGQRGYTGDALPCGASKAALINLTKSIARSFGKDGIVALAITPGWVRTSMADQYVTEHGLTHAVADIRLAIWSNHRKLANSSPLLCAIPKRH